MYLTLWACFIALLIISTQDANGFQYRFLPKPSDIDNCCTSTVTTTTKHPPPDVDGHPCGRSRIYFSTQRRFQEIEAVKGQIPWHAAIYESFNAGVFASKFPVCAGTLIGARTVVTAANCVSKASRTYQPQSLIVALGKLESNYYITESNMQTLNVEKIVVHDSYDMSTLHNNIALLILKNAADISYNTMPACFHYISFNSIRPNIKDGNLRVVPGWGQRSDSINTQTLKITTVPYVPKKNCNLRFPNADNDTTFCAGYEEDNGESCLGDPGGGLVLKKNMSLGTKWFLQGVASGTNSDNLTCVPKVSLFTKISSYSDWILHTMARNNDRAPAWYNLPHENIHIEGTAVTIKQTANADRRWHAPRTRFGE